MPRTAINPDPDVLTPKQREVLALIQRDVSRDGQTRTLAAMAKELGVSKVTLFGHVESLVAKGLVQRSRYFSRSLKPVDRPSVQLARAVLAQHETGELASLAHAVLGVR